MIDIGARYFACSECPICEELEYRRDPADNEYDFQYDHCGCDKVDGEFFMSGYCGDAFAERVTVQNRGQRKTGREYRRKMRRRKLCVAKGRSGYAGVYVAPSVNWDWVNGVWTPIGTYIQYPKSSANKGFYKRVSNKKVRRRKSIPSKGNGYRKVFDYWWTIT